MPYDQYPFELEPLTYEYGALEPRIDAETLHLHHDKHLKTYVDNLNDTLSRFPNLQTWNLTKLVSKYAQLPPSIQKSIRDNAGGVFNHNFYFKIMTPGGSISPVGKIKEMIDKKFKNYENFKSEFKKAALQTFGSGYAYLVQNGRGILSIVSVPNQDTTLPKNLKPVIMIDIWEHAYYLKYKNKRADYIDNWFELINWDIAEKFLIA